MTRPCRVATRASALAQWQARHAVELLTAADPSVSYELVLIETRADRRLDIAIDALGGKGAFVKEVQAAVLDGRADLAVHSAKDLPALTPRGLAIGAFPPRADARDALVGATLATLPRGAHVATGSARRRVQLLARRPDLVVSGLRGNIATRLAKADGFDAIVMAKAALDRLQLTPAPLDVLDTMTMLPQVGQGALAIECRAEDHAARALLGAIDHPATRRAVTAERAFLAELGGDCTLPAGAFATADADMVHMTAMLCPADRVAPRRAHGDDRDPIALGTSLAQRLRAEVGA